MPRLPSIWKILQYLPFILGFFQYFRPRETVDPAEKLETEMQDFRMSITDQVMELENTIVRLQARIRELQASILWLRNVVWFSLGVLLLAIIIFSIILSNVFHSLP